MVLVEKLDEFGKPAWIALMVLGFFVWWPLGLVTLAFILGSGRMAMGCWGHSHDSGRWERHMGRWQSKMERMQEKMDRLRSRMTLNPVAVNYQCWAARRASAHVGADGTVDYDREF